MYININLWSIICKKYAYSYSNFALWNPVADALEALRSAPWMHIDFSHCILHTNCTGINIYLMID